MRAVKARAARKSARVALPKAEYFQLRTAIRDVEAIELDAMKAAQSFHQQMAAAKARCNALFVELAKAHGFDASDTFGWDDATCELIRK